MKKFGFSWKKATGLSSAKRSISKSIGVPLTKSGRKQKINRSLGCTSVFVLILALILLTACSLNEEWIGFYYPNAYDLSEVVIEEGFTSLDECRDWVERIAPYDANYDYECGRGCNYKIEWDMYVCEVTEQ